MFLQTKRKKSTLAKTNDSQNGKSPIGGLIALIICAILLMVSFGSIALVLCLSIIGSNAGWYYFCIMGLISLFLGVIGSAFNTYSSLYLGKDNDFLLSMPIPPSAIVITRLISVYFMGVIYSSLIMIPALGVYWVVIQPGVLGVISSLLFYIVLTFIVLLLTCILGYVIAKLSLVLKNKAIGTVILALGGFAIYYVFYFKFMNYLETSMEDIATQALQLQKSAPLLYYFGSAATGNYIALLLIAVVVAVLCLGCFYVISRSFIKIATTKAIEKQKEFTSSQIISNSIVKTLYKKEFTKIFSSATVMLNSAFGVFVIPALVVFLIIKAPEVIGLAQTLQMELPEIDFSKFYPVVAFGMTCIVSSMIEITPATISLEGKNIWILQTMPLDTKLILKIKNIVQLSLSIPVCIMVPITFGIIIKMPIWETLLVVIAVAAWCYLLSTLGLALNIKHPNIHWNNEIEAVKNSMPILTMAFGPWGVMLVLAGALFLFSIILPSWILLLLYTFLFVGLGLLCERWINKKGVLLFNSLA